MQALAILSLTWCIAANAGVTVDQALRGGCFTADQLGSMYDAAIAKIEATVTLRELRKRFPDPSSFSDDGVTSTYVTAEGTWVFRGYDGDDTSKHVTGMKAGHLYSKAKIRLDREIERGGRPRQQIIDEFWADFGPDIAPIVDDARSSVTLILRLLSTKSSDVPPSQFVSVGVDYQTAASFGNPVYAFQTTGNSPLLGLIGCRLKGEYQLQIPNNTGISNLHRKRRPQTRWERYDRADDRWTFVNYPIPPPSAASPEQPAALP